MIDELPNVSCQREHAAVLAARIREPRRFLHVVAGPRQVGKTTLVQQVLAALDRPSIFVSADEPALRDAAWLGRVQRGIQAEARLARSRRRDSDR